MTGGYTMKEKNIRELAKRMGLVTVEDMCQYTIAQLVVKIANKVNELVNEVWRFETDVQEVLKTQNENIQYLLGEGLHLEVENIFDGWVQDGTFDTLINQSALKKVNDRVDENSAQLSNLVLKTGWINPDDFGGNDKEKLERAFEEARTSFKSVILTRIYDTTGLGTVNIKTRKNNRMSLYINSFCGGIKKDDAGFVFSTNDDVSADIVFNGVQFTSVSGAGTIVFDTPKLIGIKTIGCHFTNVDHLFKSGQEGYVQSYHSLSDKVTGGNGYFIDIPGAYDIKVSQLLCEYRDSYFKHRDEGVHKKLYNCSFMQSIVEGLSGQAFLIGSSEATSFNSMYFEGNQNFDIEIKENSTTNALLIENTRHGGRRQQTDYFIRIRGELDGCVIRNCTSQNTGIVDAYGVTSGYVEAINNSITVGVDFGVRYRGSEIVAKGIKEVEKFGTADRPISKVSNNLYEKWSVTATVELPVGGNSVLPFNVGTEVSREDIISVQLIPLTQNKLISARNSYRDPNDKKNINVFLKNESLDTEAKFEVCVTVLKNRISLFG